MTPYFERDGITLYCDNCLNAMANIEDNSIDTVITDPPYGLSGKVDIVALLQHWLKFEHFASSGAGFMGKKWDAIVPGPHIWREAYRVMKPGATLLCFAGTRTQDLMGIALRLAGFRLVDTIMYVFGSGFPKAADISKQIDKRAGMEREVVGEYQYPDGKKRNLAVHKAGIWDNETVHGEGFRSITAPASPEAQLWDGWKSHGLKPAHESIIVAMKPNDGNYVDNALRHGVAGLWIEGGRIPTEHTAPRYSQGKNIYGGNAFNKSATMQNTSRDCNPQGRYPSNLVLDGSEEVEALFPDTASGKLEAHHIRHQSQKVNCYGEWQDGKDSNFEGVSTYGDSGSASRFFKHCPPDTPLTDEAQRLFYCAKASRSERNAGLEEMEARFAPTMGNGIGGKEHDPETATPKLNFHPTVKPLSLMRYLTRISRTPTGGIVLDPFMGSGTTGVACVYEDREFIGIDLEPDYCEISKRRIMYALAQPQQPSFWSIPQTETPKPKQRI